ncbi:uncharacterized protein BDZ99DRAFT_464436 [Mytilinidion resinicola]|uniref:Uncharacterized protein n=1 Tax=Mytilinidion resinicola TaxID=574789 RepID=A0A6A6YL32_9PEZI|nr:uncharacterized protein BDZ99DRAFT_464436 [Mytilinidion resinicola]KAF2808577.1 hypothetical protein BDZ99DRAFT_464436 [Mytilinidion resinicola]
MAQGDMTQKRAEAIECTHHWENMLEDGSRRYQEFKKGKRDGGRVTEQHRSEESEEMEGYSSEGEDGVDQGEQPMKEVYMKARRGQKRGSEGVESGAGKRQKEDGGKKRMVRELY